MDEYIKVAFKGGWALVHKNDPELRKYEVYEESEPVAISAAPGPEVKKNAPDSRGRKRTK